MKKFMYKLSEILELGGIKKDIVLLVISCIALLISIFAPKNLLPFDAAWIAIILCGIPIILEAIIGLVTAFDIKADVLVSLALIASVCIGEFFAAGEVAFIMQLGALLEDITSAKARAGIEKLVHMTPQTARVITDGGESIIPADKVKVGDVLRVLPGETIAVDGVIISGETSVNQAVMTGESMPADKTVGEKVSSGTINQFGAFDMRAEKVGEDSSIQRMIRLVQSADAGKAKIVRTANRWATWIVVIALSAALLTWIITGEIIRAVTILVVFCPCSLVLATPTAIMAGNGNVTKHGFLVREGDALERLSTVNMICFDKTGTLTYGTPEVTAVKSISDYDENEIYSLTAAAEQYSEHPIGRAIVKCFIISGRAVPTAVNFKMTAARGVSADVGRKQVLCGNPALFEEHGITVTDECLSAADEYISDGCTVIYTAVDGIIAGLIALSDTPREESAKMISEIRAIGTEPVLLTGDNEKAAASIAERLGITEVISGCLPEDKLNYIGKMQSGGKSIAMIGDGINDAPALKKADVGIAMGGIGSDIAVDAADIVLVNDEVKQLPHLLALSGKMMRTIKLNLTFSMTLNFIAIALAMTGILNPVIGALVHNAGSVAVVLNSALLLGWKKKT